MENAQVSIYSRLGIFTISIGNGLEEEVLMKLRGKGKIVGIALCIAMLLAAGSSFAISNNECPVGLVKNLTLDVEFGNGTSEVTRCIEKRNNLKLVIQVSELYTLGIDGLPDKTRPYALGNIENIIKDYEITHGLQRGDYEIVAVILGPGAILGLNNKAIIPHKNAGLNIFQAKVEALMKDGVKFYMCQNTARNMGIKIDQIIPGVEFATAGFSAIADLQMRGYTLIHP